MKSTQRFSSELIAATIGYNLLVRQSPSLEDARYFGRFFLGDFAGFPELALQLALVMLLVGSRCKEAAKTHGN